MSLYSGEKCFVCLKRGGNLNIFTTYSICNETEELYVEVIKNCFNIEITLDTGLTALCNDCSLKLRNAYSFKHAIVQALHELLLMQVTDTTAVEKQYTRIEYLNDIPFENSCNYTNSDLNLEADHILYSLDKINDNQEINLNLDGGIIIDNKEETSEQNEVEKSAMFKDVADSLVNLDGGHLHYTLERICQEELNIKGQNNDLRSIDNVVEEDVAGTVSFLKTANRGNNLDYINQNDEDNVAKDTVMKVDVQSVKKSNVIEKNNNPEICRIFYTFGEVHENVKNAYVINVASDMIADKNKISKKSKGKNIKRKDLRNVDKANSVLNPETGPVHDSLDLNTKTKLNENNQYSDLVNLENADVAKKDVNKNRGKKCIKKKYKSNTVLNPETGHISYTLHKINDNDPSNPLVDIENDVIVDKTEVSKIDKGKKIIKKDIRKKDVDKVKENMPGIADVKVEKEQKKEKKVTKFIRTLDPNQTVCSVCTVEFETNTALLIHMGSHPAEYTCSVCEAKFDTNLKLRVHKRSHNEGPFNCKFCAKEFSNVNTRNTHEWRVHSKTEPFKCARCGERFKTYLKRLRHLQTVHGDTPEYPCQFCDKKFAYAAYRTKHVRITHLNARPYKCPHCPAAFAKRGGVDSHMACKHGVGEMKYQCGVCSRRFYVKTALGLHMNTHKLRYSCFECEQKFETIYALESHTKTHETVDNNALNMDFVTSLQFDVLADDYALMDSSYMDLNEL